MQVKSIVECSTGAFCNTFHLHYAIIGLENKFLFLSLSDHLRQDLLYVCKIVEVDAHLSCPNKLIVNLHIFEGQEETGGKGGACMKLLLLTTYQHIYQRFMGVDSQ